MGKISIVVVDDHKLIRQMWKKMFSDNEGLEVVGETGVFQEAIEMIMDKRPDIVLLDINLGYDSGLDAVPLIRKFSPGTRIITVSMHNKPAYARKMLRLGARGYVTKNSSLEEIVLAIEQVMEGRVYVCAEIKSIISAGLMLNDPIGSDIRKLSFREIEVVKLLKDGLTSKEISLRLNISVRTVEVHRHNILKKLKLKTTASLIKVVNNTEL